MEESEDQPLKDIYDDRGQQHRSLYYRLEEIPQPKESFGGCKNAANCGEYRAVLGDGVCTACWDKGLDKKYKESEERQKSRKERKKNRSVCPECERPATTSGRCHQCEADKHADFSQSTPS